MIATAGNVTVIPATISRGKKITKEEKPKLKVAAYCRVSTDTTEQETSFTAQVEHYTTYIGLNTDWQFAGIYADEGISGTNMKNREQFIKMIEDCCSGKIDMVITKSVSRFARNTMDCLQTVRLLKEHNVAVFFEKENINTLDSKGEVLLTIMASLAQQESESLSKNVQMGIQYRFQQGKVFLNYSRFLGYTKTIDGKYVIVPEEAEIVKRIYREFLEGNSLSMIAEGLEKDGIKAIGGGTKWHPVTLRSILRNEKYTGDAILQKYYTSDVLQKKHKRNNGEKPQYFVKNAFEPIIPKEVHIKVQEELNRRSMSSEDGKYIKFRSKVPFSHLVFCGKCGAAYKRTKWLSGDKITPMWICSTRKQRGGKLLCDAKALKESNLEKIVVEAVNKCYADKKEYLAIMKKAINEMLECCTQERIDKIDGDINRIAALVEAGSQDSTLGLKLNELLEEKEKIAAKELQAKHLEEVTDSFQEFLANGEIKEFTPEINRKFIEKLMVYQDKVIVHMIGGMKVEINK